LTHTTFRLQAANFHCTPVPAAAAWLSGMWPCRPVSLKALAIRLEFDKSHEVNTRANTRLQNIVTIRYQQ